MSLIKTTRAIQRELGVKADGIYGPVTAGKMLEALKQVPHPETGVTITSAPTSSKNFTFDKRTEKNLATLLPGAQKKFRPFIAQAQAIAASMGYDYRAISGNRTYAEQNALYAQGRTKPGNRVTNARGGYSSHNFAIALDFGVFKGSQYLDSADPKTAQRVHAAVSECAEKHGIAWGGNWKSFKDTPHFEINVGMTTAQKRAAVKAGRSLV